MKGASSTARMIAACIVLQDEEGTARQWLPAVTIALSRATLASSGHFARALLSLLRRRWMRRLGFVLERHLLPGVQAHFLLRKHRIAHWATQSIAAGTRQVIILGAGMDGLGLHLSQANPELNVVEVDHPATQALKRQILENVAPGHRLTLIGADLGATIKIEQLSSAGLRPDEATFVVAEGLLMYLPARACLRLLNQFATGLGGKLDIAFSAMQSDANGRVGFARPHAMIDRWLRWRGEPFCWGTGAARIESCLRLRGLQTCVLERGDEPPSPAFPRWVPCTGENLYLAARAGQCLPDCDVAG
jgi:methyltransferase (TIGR00027 family)